MKNNRATILGFEVDLMRFDEALDYITEKSENQSTQTITINPEMMALGDKNEEFANILKTADLVIPDGFGVKLGLKIKGIEQERIPGIEFAKKQVKELLDFRVDGLHFFPLNKSFAVSKVLEDLL